MGLERRGHSSYYYRKYRIGKKVISRYVDSGIWATMAEREDREKRNKIRKILERRNKKIEKDKLLRQKVDEFSSFAEGAVDIAMLLSGYHKHKGQWRRKRHAVHN